MRVRGRGSGVSASLTWQKLCPHGVDTGSSNRSRQMEHVSSCSENGSEAPASAMLHRYHGNRSTDWEQRGPPRESRQTDRQTCLQLGPLPLITPHLSRCDQEEGGATSPVLNDEKQRADVTQVIRQVSGRLLNFCQK